MVPLMSFTPGAPMYHIQSELVPLGVSFLEIAPNGAEDLPYHYLLGCAKAISRKFEIFWGSNSGQTLYEKFFFKTIGSNYA
jgi:hypothetical protein